MNDPIEALVADLHESMSESNRRRRDRIGPLPAIISQALASRARQHRLRRLAVGISQGLLLAALLLIMIMLADLGFRPDTGVRVFLSLFALSMTVVCLCLWLAVPLLRRLDQMQLAREIEAGHPLGEALGLSATIDLYRQGQAAGSIWMINRTAAMAGQALHGSEEKMPRVPLPRKRLMSAGVVVLALLLTVLIHADARSLFVRALVPHGDLVRPASTIISSDTAQQQVVLRGDDVLIQARIIPQPQTAELVIHWNDGLQERLACVGGSDGVWKRQLNSLTQSCQWQIRAGDAVTAMHSITVKEPKRISSVRMDISPQRYTGLPDRQSDERHETVYVGTTINWSVSMQDQSHGSLVLVCNGKDQSIQGMTDGQARFTVNADESFDYHFDLIQNDGRRVEIDRRRSVTVLQDEAPQIHLHQLQHSQIIDPDLPLLFRLEVSDDISLTAVTTEWSIEGRPGRSRRSFSLAAGDDRLVESFMLDPKVLAVAAGDVIKIRAIAEDKGGQVTLSPGQRLHVVGAGHAERHRRLQTIEGYFSQSEKLLLRLQALGRRWNRLRQEHRIADPGAQQGRWQLLHASLDRWLEEVDDLIQSLAQVPGKDSSGKRLRRLSHRWSRWVVEHGQVMRSMADGFTGSDGERIAADLHRSEAMVRGAERSYMRLQRLLGQAALVDHLANAIADMDWRLERYARQTTIWQGLQAWSSDSYLPGLYAIFKDRKGREYRDRMAAVFENVSVPEVEPKDFTVELRGMVKHPGSKRCLLTVSCEGGCEIILDGQSVLPAEAKEAKGANSWQYTCKEGLHGWLPVVIRYRQRGERSALQCAWQDQRGRILPWQDQRVRSRISQGWSDEQRRVLMLQADPGSSARARLGLMDDARRSLQIWQQQLHYENRLPRRVWGRYWSGWHRTADELTLTLDLVKQRQFDPVHLDRVQTLLHNGRNTAQTIARSVANALDKELGKHLVDSYARLNGSIAATAQLKRMVDRKQGGEPLSQDQRRQIGIQLQALHIHFKRTMRDWRHLATDKQSGKEQADTLVRNFAWQLYRHIAYKVLPCIVKIRSEMQQRSTLAVASMHKQLAELAMLVRHAESLESGLRQGQLHQQQLASYVEASLAKAGDSSATAAERHAVKGSDLSQAELVERFNTYAATSDEEYQELGQVLEAAQNATAANEKDTFEHMLQELRQYALGLGIRAHMPKLSGQAVDGKRHRLADSLLQQAQALASLDHADRADALRTLQKNLKAGAPDSEPPPGTEDDDAMQVMAEEARALGRREDTADRLALQAALDERLPAQALVKRAQPEETTARQGLDDNDLTTRQNRLAVLERARDSLRRRRQASLEEQAQLAQHLAREAQKNPKLFMGPQASKELRAGAVQLAKLSQQEVRKLATRSATPATHSQAGASDPSRDAKATVVEPAINGPSMARLWKAAHDLHAAYGYAWCLPPHEIADVRRQASELSVLCRNTSHGLGKDAHAVSLHRESLLLDRRLTATWRLADLTSKRIDVLEVALRTLPDNVHEALPQSPVSLQGHSIFAALDQLAKRAFTEDQQQELRLQLLLELQVALRHQRRHLHLLLVDGIRAMAQLSLLAQVLSRHGDDDVNQAELLVAGSDLETQCLKWSKARQMQSGINARQHGRQLILHALMMCHLREDSLYAYVRNHGSALWTMYQDFFAESPVDGSADPSLPDAASCASKIPPAIVAFVAEDLYRLDAVQERTLLEQIERTLIQLDARQVEPHKSRLRQRHKRNNKPTKLGAHVELEDDLKDMLDDLRSWVGQSVRIMRAMTVVDTWDGVDLGASLVSDPGGLGERSESDTFLLWYRRAQRQRQLRWSAQLGTLRRAVHKFCGTESDEVQLWLRRLDLDLTAMQSRTDLQQAAVAAVADVEQVKIPDVVQPLMEELQSDLADGLAQALLHGQASKRQRDRLAQLGQQVRRLAAREQNLHEQEQRVLSERQALLQNLTSQLTPASGPVPSRPDATGLERLRVQLAQAHKRAIENPKDKKRAEALTAARQRYGDLLHSRQQALHQRLQDLRADWEGTAEVRTDAEGQLLLAELQSMQQSTDALALSMEAVRAYGIPGDVREIKDGIEAMRDLWSAGLADRFRLRDVVQPHEGASSASAEKHSMGSLSLRDRGIMAAQHLLSQSGDTTQRYEQMADSLTAYGSASDVQHWLQQHQGTPGPGDQQLAALPGASGTSTNLDPVIPSSGDSADWARLPDRLRRSIHNDASELFAGDQRRIIERYFSRLADMP